MENTCTTEYADLVENTNNIIMNYPDLSALMDILIMVKYVGHNAQNIKNSLEMDVFASLIVIIVLLKDVLHVLLTRDPIHSKLNVSVIKDFSVMKMDIVKKGL